MSEQHPDAAAPSQASAEHAGASDRPARTPAQILATPAQFLAGGGPKRVDMLERLGLHTAKDLLFNFPRDYQDLTDVRTIDAFEEGRLVSTVGTVEDIDSRVSQAGRSVVGVLFRQGAHYLRGIWFNMPFIREHFVRGQSVLLSGQPKYVGGRWEMVHPRIQFVELSAVDQAQGRVLPIYSLTEGISQAELRKITASAVELCTDLIGEVFPTAFLAEHRLLPIREALPTIHFPADKQQLAAARRRFVYQELFILQLALAIKRRQTREAGHAPILATSARIDARIKRLLPFELTAGQMQVIDEIAADLARDQAMNRLLQGDVGSGKTVVALYAMLVAVAAGHQAVLMAPTEVLARQHFASIGALLAQSHVRIALVAGSVAPEERREAERRIAAGEVDLVIGTQAIVRGELEFARLGLVVIDEQHKFGVRQRAYLKSAGDPHYLVMTATPIPRTLAMTVFGDLDVSTLADQPPNRQPVHTYLVAPGERDRWFDFLRRKLTEGRQAYLITPLVEESEDSDVANVQHTYEAFANGELEAFRLAVLHGRMNAQEKDAVMTAFRSGEIQAIVATSVVEVGVDVPNATLMTIIDAQRFGLAQLHQLRGRIRRGKYPGYCALFSDPKNEEARTRLDALVQSDNGFELAEIDFKLRGPGDLLGTRQHGLPPLMIADLERDRELLVEARADAQSLVSADPQLAAPELALLRRMVLARYGQSLDLGDVG
jgi:ATP-dependent DNA helicase RecG